MKEKDFETVESHYRVNFTKLVKIMTNRVVDKSHAYAEEVVQEAYARAIKYYPSFNRSKKPFDKWFRTILNNTLRDHKKEEKNTAASIEEIAEVGIEPVKMPPYLLKEVAAQVKAYSPEKQEVILLWLKYSYKPREIAEVVSMSPTNIRKTLSLFRQDLIDIKENF